MAKATVGVFGGTGYGGREIVRLLAAHPRAQVAFQTGSAEGFVPHEEGLARDADAYLLSMPHGVSATYVAKLHEAHPRAVIVDLSGDLRLPTPAAYKQWYGHDHPAPALLGGTPYGLTEVYRDRLKGARVVSNPGCYATSVLLPLIPLLRSKLVDPADVIVDAKSGASGAGRTAREDLIFCEVSENFSAYSFGRVHRHVGEIEAVLADAAKAEVVLTFCPHLLPVKRGILSALYLKTPRKAAELKTALAGFYEGEPFVKVVEKAPQLQEVQYTNDCRISVHDAAPGRVVVFSALDNLVKGAAGQAIQNMNLAMGFAETDGLPVGALSPPRVEGQVKGTR
jgi:N-acetyl-gamma-glutamyl-phosphate reductase